jgi:hypothetical protein
VSAGRAVHGLIWEGQFVRNLSTLCGQSALRFHVDNVRWEIEKVTCKACRALAQKVEAEHEH